MTKINKTVAAAKIMCHALNEISFFASSSEAASALIRARAKANINNNGLIKLRPSLS
jgi:hypothetical protein